MILCDRQIATLITDNNMVQGHSKTCLNPASLDVRLGRYIKYETAHGWREHDLQPAPGQQNPYLLTPKEFILAHTCEMFNLPDGHGACDQAIAARFALKSSAGRVGLQHLMAAYCDPGWHGSTLTLELVNVSSYHPIKLHFEQRIGQMIFETVAVPERSYAEVGRYNNDLVVTHSKGF
jgi:deoxycytidine triphosphate deaminase